jgi:diaminohydroxyphosphoribosylaminopyrimidine deaminase / 5-amino-6-(5-phosphoribosylamino)uracil reductase
VSFSDADETFMRRALSLAAAQLGRVAPNPAVGCVLVRGGAILTSGATGPGGRPHAEETALEAAGSAAAGATAYVSLEPCAKRSSGAPSCAERLAAAGLARVVVACREPNPQSMGGADRLRAAGVRVEIGLCEADAIWLNRGFFKRLATGRPWLAVDPAVETYDAPLEVRPGESLTQALDRLGAAGLTRVVVTPGTPLCAEAQALGLVDETVV